MECSAGEKEEDGRMEGKIMAILLFAKPLKLILAGQP
jgi:hypothetical protein